MGLAFPNPPLRIYLVGSDHVGWQALRALLRETSGVEVVGETRDAGEAVRAVARLRPNGVVVAIDVVGMSPVELVAGMRKSGPETKVLVFGGEPGYELEIALAELDVDSFLLWEDVTRETVFACLYGALVAEVRVVSPRAVEAVVANSIRRDRALLFSEQQRQVLHGLAAGQEEADIASETRLGLRTVERRIGELKTLLGVRTVSELADKARDLGFGTDTA